MSSLETVSPGNGSGTIYACDIPAERPWSRVLKRGQTLRIVDSDTARRIRCARKVRPTSTSGRGWFRTRAA